MVLSQRSQYAVRAVFELSKSEGEGRVKAARIASAQHIPLRFLENILAQLRQAEIVESARGKEGGYRLRRSPREVTVGDVVRLIQGPMSSIECAENNADDSGACPMRPGCVLLPMWEKAHQAMMDVFDGATFADLLEQELAAHGCEAINYAI